MERTSEHALLNVIDEFYLLVSESADYQLDVRVRDVLLELSELLLKIRWRQEQALRRYVIAVVGLTNVGKSTLLNALLGDDLAPRRNGPCTAMPIEFSFAAEREVTLSYRDSLQRRVQSWSTAGELQTVLSNWGGEAGSTKARVVVHLPHPLLEQGLVLADTPGFGAAQFDEAAGTHEAAVRQYLKEEVSQVFWVVLGEQGIGQREVQFRDQCFGEICDDVVVGLGEEWTAREKERYQQRYRSVFHRSSPQFHFVRSLEILQAGQAATPEQLEEAGKLHLERRIAELALPDRREQTLATQLSRAADDWRFWFVDYTRRSSPKMKSAWRPDSWARWCSFARSTASGRLLSQQLSGEQA